MTTCTGVFVERKHHEHIDGRDGAIFRHGDNVFSVAFEFNQIKSWTLPIFGTGKDGTNRFGRIGWGVKFRRSGRCARHGPCDNARRAPVVKSVDTADLKSVLSSPFC